MHTDDRSYRQDLKKTINNLEAVRRSMEAPFQTTPESYASS